MKETIKEIFNEEEELTLISKCLASITPQLQEQGKY